ncbi:MAG: alanine racemase [Clostridia bacterium]|nr:alanine racemase [Clostridia bacterium]
MKYLEIKKDDLIFNIQKLKEHCAPARIIAVLKGNAYGLDMVKMGHILLENGVDLFAVSELSEAVALRDAGFENEIILLTPTNDVDEARLIADNKITATVASIENARLLNGIGLPIDAHIKIDTGFGRYGFYTDELTEELKSFKNITYKGVFSHFSNSFGDEAYSKKQFGEFEKSVARLEELGIKTELKHICNSCGAIRFDYARMDAVRIGSAFLGRLPIPNTLGLKRLVSLKCSVGEIRNLPKGSVVGYANTYVTKRDTVAAVIPVGYKDGYGVRKSDDVFRFKDVLRYMLADFKMWKKKIHVEINGKKYPVIGRISMHNIVVDVTDSSVKAGDIATLECNPILIKSEIERLYI